MQSALSAHPLLSRSTLATAIREVHPVVLVRRFIAVAATATLLTGGLVLVGWMCGSTLLMGGVPGLVAMNPATAVAFILAGLAQWLLRREHPRPNVACWGRLLAAGVATTGLVQLVVYGAEWEFGLDRLLFAEHLQNNRMAPNTAICFVLIGMALLTLNVRRGRMHEVSQACALAVATCSLLTLVGYGYSVRALYGVSGYIPMAVNTAVVFQILSISVALARTDRGFAALLTSPHLGGYMARRLLPAAVAIPCTLGWLRILGQRAGWYETEFGAALMVSLTVVILVGVVCWTGSVLNRTDADRKESAEALSQSARHVRDLYNRAPCGYHSLDASGRITAINDTELEWLGYERHEVEGKLHFADLISPESRCRFEEHFPAFKQDGSATDLEFELVRKDGSTLPVILSATAIRDAAGNYVASRSTLFDATEQRRAERAVRQLNEQLEQRVDERTAQLAAANQDLAQKNQENETFVYSVSHDLRSPLVNLQGFSRELASVSEELRELVTADSVPAKVRERSRELIDGEMEQSIHFIQSAVSRLSNIIDALLRLSRAGRVTYQNQLVKVDQVVSRIVDSLAATIGSRDAAVEVHELPPAHGDPAALEQVFANLIDNALKYLDPSRPGKIEIGCVTEPSDPAAAGGRNVTYYVKDNGLGIPETCREKIFLAFRRAHPEAGPGEGMGLAIARRVVERHGGRLWVESTAGEGTTFFISLPQLTPIHADRTHHLERSFPHGSRPVGHPVG